MHVVKEVSESDFNAAVALDARPLLIEFWAEWCGPCKALAPTVEKVSLQFEGAIDFFKVNIDNNSSMGKRYNVRTIPTLVLFESGHELGRLSGNCSARQLTGFLDARVGTATETFSPGGGHRVAYHGDRRLRSECLSRLEAHLSVRRVESALPLWETPATSTLSFVCGSNDPDDAARFLGISASTLALVEVLSTYHGTHLCAAEFIHRWLAAVKIGIDLSRLPNKFILRVLDGTLLTSLVTKHPVLIEPRNRLQAMQRAMSGSALPSQKSWTEIREACGSIQDNSLDWECSTAAGILKAAAWPLDMDPALITDFVVQVCGYGDNLLKWKCGWDDKEYEYLHEIAAAYSNEIREKGKVPPRGDALTLELSKIHPDFMERFKYVHEEGSRRAKQTGLKYGDLCVDLTAQHG